MQRDIALILTCFFVYEKAPITFNCESEIANFVVVEFLTVMTLWDRAEIKYKVSRNTYLSRCQFLVNIALRRPESRCDGRVGSVGTQERLSSGYGQRIGALE